MNLVVMTSRSVQTSLVDIPAGDDFDEVDFAETRFVDDDSSGETGSRALLGIGRTDGRSVSRAPMSSMLAEP